MISDRALNAIPGERKVVIEDKAKHAADRETFSILFGHEPHHAFRDIGGRERLRPLVLITLSRLHS